MKIVTFLTNLINNTSIGVSNEGSIVSKEELLENADSHNYKQIHKKYSNMLKGVCFFIIILVQSCNYRHMGWWFC